MRCVFLFPPSFDPTAPPLSLSRIKGCIETTLREIDAQFLDENYGFVRYVLSLPLSEKEDPIKDDLMKSLAVLKIRELFLNIRNYSFAYETLLKVFHKFSQPFYPSLVGYATQRFAHNIRDTKQVSLLLESERFNPYLTYFNLRLEHILGSDPEVLGISVIYSSQLVPALTLSRLAKQRKKDLLIILGGPYVSSLRKAILKNFSFIDQVIPGDAEAFFEEVKDIKLTKNRLIELIEEYCKKRAYFSPLKYPLDLSWTNPLEYPLPEPVLLLDITRGCYYKKCVFCSYGHQGSSYRRMRITDIIKTIKESKLKRVFFSVDVVDPSFLEELARALIKAGVEITYCLDARLETTFTDELFVKLIYESGCRAISFGMESASQNTLDKMKKGTNCQNFSRILKNLNKTGIHVQLHLIHGFPTETKEDLQKTIEFLKTHREEIVTVGISEFTLLKGSAMEKRPQDYDISCIEPAGDLALDYEYYTDQNKDYPNFEKIRNHLFMCFPAVGRLTGSTTDYLIYASYYSPDEMRAMLRSTFQ